MIDGVCGGEAVRRSAESLTAQNERETSPSLASQKERSASVAVSTLAFIPPPPNLNHSAAATSAGCSSCASFECACVGTWRCKAAGGRQRDVGIWGSCLVAAGRAGRGGAGVEKRVSGLFRGLCFLSFFKASKL